MNRNNDIISCMCSPSSHWRIMKCSSCVSIGIVDFVPPNVLRACSYLDSFVYLKPVVLSTAPSVSSVHHDWYFLVSFHQLRIFMQLFAPLINYRKCQSTASVLVCHIWFWLMNSSPSGLRVSVTRFQKSQKPFKLFLLCFQSHFTPAFRLSHCNIVLPFL